MGKQSEKNKGSVDTMEKVGRAILYHWGSCDRKPMHKHCPKGADRWCGWQRDCKSYEHHNTVPSAIFKRAETNIYKVV